MSDTIHRLILETGQAEVKVETIKKGLDAAAVSGKKAGKEINSGLQEAKRGVVGIVNDLTGGLASKFMDVKDAIVGATKGMSGFKAALVGTGIGLLVIALGAIVGYKDELYETFFGASEQATELAKATKEIADATRDYTDKWWPLMERALKAQGVLETEILARKKEILKQELETQKAALQAQINKSIEVLALEEADQKRAMAYGAKRLNEQTETQKEQLKLVEDFQLRIKEINVLIAEGDKRTTDITKEENDKKIQSNKDYLAKREAMDDEAQKVRENDAKDFVMKQVAMVPQLLLPDQMLADGKMAIQKRMSLVKVY